MLKVRNFCKSLFITIAMWGILPAQATPVDVSAPRPLVPPNVTTSSNRPMIMLAASKDHSMFGPVYTDFEDLDDDGTIDTTFKPTFKYYGYFDPTKCYAYDNTSKQFNPAASSIIITSTVTTNGVTRTLERYTCTSAQSYWSGNFLNWSTMTRLDVVRKMLYGGTRSTDATGNTVLERAKLNWDAHSFVKYYRGTDIRDYTPFTTAALTKTTGSNPNVYAGLSICNLGTNDSTTASPNPPIMRMVKGNVRFWATVEYEVCQWRDTYNSGTFGPKLARYYRNSDIDGISHEVTIPSIARDGATYSSIGPELTVRVKVCDPAFIGEERCQAFPSNSTTNLKPYGLFQEFGYAAAGTAARAEFGVITGNYSENYTAGTLRKNMGDFADEINPSTGIFCHSASSGCATTLAAPDGRTTGIGAIKTFDSILLNDRTSRSYGSSGTPSSVSQGSLSSWGNPIGEMLVQALQYYSYDGSTPSPTNPSTTTKDTALGLPTRAWSDPLSNTNTTRNSLYGNSICRPLNTLLLSSSSLSFDGQAATPFATLPNRTGDIASYTNTVGATEGINNSLRSIGSVTGGYGDSCSAKNVVNLSDVSGICPETPAMGGTYQVAGAALYGNTSKIRTVATPPSDLQYVKNALKVKTLAASLTGGAPRIDVLVPGTGTSASNPAKYVYITPESLQGGGGISAPLTFASISASATHGAFIVTWNDILMGGDYDMDIVGYLRYDIITNSTTPVSYDIKITTDIPGVCGGGAGTHGFSIIGVKNLLNADANGRYLTHQHYNSGTLSGMPATSQYLCGDNTYRNLTSPANTTYRNLTLTSPAFAGAYSATVCNVTGTGATGDPDIPTAAAYCTVKDVDYPVSLTFHMDGASDALIKDPLFYAAKYGSFDSSTKNNNNTYTDLALPPSVDSWDKVKSDGSLGADGVPDNYFLARRPDLLEAQLRKALDSLAKNANSAPATTSGQLAEGSYKYVAKFDSTTVTGDVAAYKLLSSGAFDSNPTWEAGESLKIRASTDYVSPNRPGNSRQIITNFGNKSTTNTAAAMRFRWADLPAGYVTQMTTSSTNTLSTTNAALVLNYMRGDQSLESASTGLRERGDNLLGPIVNATPWVQAPPSANFLEYQSPGYTAFANNSVNVAREKLLWVSANDGMLHAFCAEGGGTVCPTGGSELFAYVPGMLANRLAEIPLQRGIVGRTRLQGANFTLDATETQPDSTVWAYVDGSPFTADVKTNIVAATSTTVETGTWKTMAFSSLGRGGRGIFALDVTNISTLAAAESNPNSIFQWQFTRDDDDDLGYLVGDIGTNTNTRQANPVVKLNNGKFGLLLGNGYRSANGKAALFILFVDGPSITSGWTGQYVKIVADAGPNNGLMGVTWLDRDNNGTADAVYAGDLKGNLWKFDISSTVSTANWDVAYKGTGTPAVNRPLFTAQNSVTTGNVTTVTPLPIVAAPEYVYPAFDGLIINFGTGNALETGDFPKTSVPQRIFGLWDRPAFSSTDQNGTGPMIQPDLSTLVTRAYARSSTGVVTATPNSTTGGVSTYTAIDWTSKDGWYFNFPGASPPPNTPNLSEMLLADPDVQAGYLLFPTVRQKVGTESCNNTPDVTLYIIDPIAGIPTRKAQGLASDGTLIAGTPVISQKWVTVTNRSTATYKPQTCVAGEAGCNNVNATTGIGEKDATCPPGSKALSSESGSESRTLCYNPLGRVQWREIPGLRTDQ
ncbi:type IV pilus assembly protein PilY1 [Rhodoferax ferrireducens]|uniref:Type IV pilus assembly protein PilY1 n=1 Tax=Rhodoferax ferrireducens TaxID=192843 RepID=A0ABU2C7X1_9BURK|nr:PilC/PilY family type IV pilus protein [Rhodoferax ferrireducens]MDR7377401.1 type IV pilus assembly protein PilY1 [Rhodoferax ferrireducens]